MTIETQHDKSEKMDTPLPSWVLLLMPVYLIILLGFPMFFFTQTLAWLEAWLFLISFSMNMTISYLIINKKNPRLIRNRTKLKKVGLTDKTKKPAGTDKIILPVMAIGLLLAFALIIFDYNTKWTPIPFGVEIIGLVIFNIGLTIMNIAQLQNAYASKILDINKGQKLIDTGLYAHIRHPLYSGSILWMLSLPISLGSWVSLIPAILAVIPLIIRVKYEEEMLIKGMEGYEDYKTRVKYKLIPYIY